MSFSIGFRFHGGSGAGVLWPLAVAAALTASACQPAGSVPGTGALTTSVPTRLASKDDGVSLRVANCCGVWNDATSRGADARFTQATGATLAYTEAYAEQLAPQVIAAGGKNPPYDIVFTDDQVQTQLAEAGLIEKYDPNTLKEAADVSLPPLNKGYPPGVWLYYIGIAYNAQIFQEQGIPTPKSWADFWNPKLAGHVEIPALSTPQGLPAVVAAAAVAGSDPYDLIAGVDKLAELKPYAVYKSSGQYQTDLSTGNAWAAITADGRVWQLADSDKPIHFVLPEVPGMNKKGFSARVYVDIVIGTPRLDLAKIYQQLASDATTQIAVAQAAGYSPVLPSAIKDIVSNDAKWGQRWPAIDELPNISSVDWHKALPQLQQTTDYFGRRLSS